MNPRRIQSDTEWRGGTVIEEVLESDAWGLLDAGLAGWKHGRKANWRGADDIAGVRGASDFENATRGLSKLHVAPLTARIHGVFHAIHAAVGKCLPYDASR